MAVSSTGLTVTDDLVMVFVAEGGGCMCLSNDRDAYGLYVSNLACSERCLAYLEETVACVSSLPPALRGVFSYPEQIAAFSA